jgi:type VI secretion system secreted protein Hcp
MAADAFLKITRSGGDFVKGESLADKHKDEIEVLSFSWGVSQQGTHAVGGGGGAGKSSFHDFSVFKNFDKASPVLFVAACQGEQFPQAVFTLRKAGGDQQDFYKVTMSDVIVTNWVPAATTAGDGSIPMEQLSLNFSKVEIEYKPQNQDGSLGAAVKGFCGVH